MTSAGITIETPDEEINMVKTYHRLYEQIGQFLPYKPDMLAQESTEEGNRREQLTGNHRPG